MTARNERWGHAPGLRAQGAFAFKVRASRELPAESEQRLSVDTDEITCWTLLDRVQATLDIERLARRQADDWATGEHPDFDDWEVDRALPGRVSVWNDQSRSRHAP